MNFKIDTNLKRFLAKAVIFVAIVFLSRVIFQFPVEYFNLEIFKQTAGSRLFSKIDALQVVLLISLFFGFYFKDRINTVEHKKQSLLKSALLIAAGEAVIAVYYSFRAAVNYFGITDGMSLLLMQGAILLALVAAAILFALAAFSKEYLTSFIKEFKKEIAISALAGVILYNALIFFQKQWLVFSSGVTKVLVFLLSNFYHVSEAVAENGAPVLDVNNFLVVIGPPCSGIESMFLFSAFFAGLFALDHSRLKKPQFFLSFVIGLAGVYMINMLRLFLLIIAGVHISPAFAVGLFHTNAGWVLFAAYFLCYYIVIKRFIYLKDTPPNK